MNKKKTIILGIIVLTIVMITGVTFALWQITLKQSTTNVITTGCFKIEFQDENPISLSNAFPITDEEGRVLIPYTFTITNTCESYASYQINLEVLKDTTLESFDYLKVMLEDNKDLLSKKETVSKTLENATTAKKLETGYLDINGSKTYHLRLWMSEDTPNDKSFMNKVFQSKVTVIATYQTEFDYDKPIVVLNATKENGSLNIDASSSTDNTSIKNYYYSLDGENWISSKNNTHEFQEERKIEYGVGTSAIISLYNSTIHKVYLKVEDEYGNMSEVVSTDFLDELEYDGTTDNNLRYIGSNPNNYVSFNNELWRIIGVMENIEDGEGKKETRVKLIRDESIGEYSWDSSPDNVNYGTGINEWSQADLNYLLNDFYFNSKSEQICYVGSNLQKETCTFKDFGLNNVSRGMIGETKWNTGANGPNMAYNELPANRFYEFERSIYNGKYCDSKSFLCNDEITRQINWIGKIALMHPSDYSYAVSARNHQERQKCLQKVFYSWNDECKNENWLEHSGVYQWTIMPLTFFNSARGAFRVSGDTNEESFAASYPNEVYPALYLKSNIKITNGLGTKEQPFELSL